MSLLLPFEPGQVPNMYCGVLYHRQESEEVTIELKNRAEVKPLFLW